MFFLLMVIYKLLMFQPEINLASVTLKPTPKNIPEETDPRSDLLKAIREGEAWGAGYLYFHF